MHVTKAQTAVIQECIKDKSSFRVLSEKLGLSYTKTSNLLGFLAKSKNNAEIFEKYKWPTNINKGFIYLGAFKTAPALDKNGKETGGSLCEGERAGLLKPGDYVLKGDYDKGVFTEIFAPYRAVETKYLILDLPFNSTPTKDGKKDKINYCILHWEIEMLLSSGVKESDERIVKYRKEINKLLMRNLRVRTEVWVSEYDISCGKLDEFKESTWNCKFKKNTHETRIVYYTGKSLGVVNKRTLCSVLK